MVDGVDIHDDQKFAEWKIENKTGVTVAHTKMTCMGAW
jgi:hypothetical protein